MSLLDTLKNMQKLGRWFKIPSETTPHLEYTVVRTSQGVWQCSCPAKVYTPKAEDRPCKHIEEIKPLVEKQEVAEGWLNENMNTVKFEEGLKRYQFLMDRINSFEFQYDEHGQAGKMTITQMQARLIEMGEEKRKRRMRSEAKYKDKDMKTIEVAEAIFSEPSEKKPEAMFSNEKVFDSTPVGEPSLPRLEHQEEVIKEPIDNPF